MCFRSKVAPLSGVLLTFIFVLPSVGGGGLFGVPQVATAKKKKASAAILAMSVISSYETSMGRKQQPADFLSGSPAVPAGLHVEEGPQEEELDRALVPAQAQPHLLLRP